MYEHLHLSPLRGDSPEAAESSWAGFDTLCYRCMVHLSACCITAVLAMPLGPLIEGLNEFMNV